MMMMAMMMMMVMMIVMLMMTQMMIMILMGCLKITACSCEYSSKPQLACVNAVDLAYL